MKIHWFNIFFEFVCISILLAGAMLSDIINSPAPFYLALLIIFASAYFMGMIEAYLSDQPASTKPNSVIST